MRSLATIASILFAASAALAQNATYPCITIEQIIENSPTCVRGCQVSSLKQDGCDFEDVTCHCLNSGAIEGPLVPCLNNSGCSTTDLTDFENYIDSVCTYINATANGVIPAPSCKPSTVTTAVETGTTTVPCESSTTTTPSPVKVWSSSSEYVAHTTWTTAASWSSPSPTVQKSNSSSNSSWGSSPIQFQGSASSQFVLSSGLLAVAGIAFAVLF